ncbi:26S proteasome regulatory subunit N1 isoform 1 [Galdieria sulphuraria]|uniref:26S proteasome regulatory subunit N1 isoform 1 n=2 Tax=Galdieria sulphuraria TaxID=130081 RepID=M2Y6E5_GALSU|nr:26S proteasome regulatory subunit N1 isoform 1 [Galdieria sulphuraria]EME31419.1 26S proteasome regulatory subunit N1 isoform 1 [Galdieria sulphuraria]|eukprot:XP_005707939.1 26S proteasome regulatory subunit N1 isoform 1 [Galdieria sulphuraria]
MVQNQNNTNHSLSNSRGDKKMENNVTKEPNTNETEELSEEDRQMKEEFDLLAERVQDPDLAVQKLALETLKSEIRSSTSSMTSLPKPLKFMSEHYEPLKTFFQTMVDGENKRALADILSVLSMTMAPEDSLDCLHYKLLGTQENPESWGHEYVRHLAGEISQEYEKRILAEGQDSGMEDIMSMVKQIVPFLLSSNAEPEACDLLYEVDHLKSLVDYAEEANFERICLYLLSSADYVPEPDVFDILQVACSIYRKLGRSTQAMRVAIRLGDMELMSNIYQSDPEKDALGNVVAVRTQLALDLASRNIFLEEETNEDLKNWMGNTRLYEFYLSLAKDLDVMEPKTPEDIYKSHLTDGIGRLGLNSNLDSARQNLAATFVNAFANLGFGKDKLLMDEESRWVFRNKDHGMMSATASYGALMLWDIDSGLAELDKYMYASEEYVQAGALLGIGIVSSGIRSEVDPALALLSEHVENPRSSSIRIGAILGLGFAYAGTCRMEIQELLIPIVADASAPLDTLCFAALSLGLVFQGSADEELVSTLIQALLDRDLASWENESMIRLLPLSLAMLYTGRRNGTDAVIEAIQAQIPGAPGRVAARLVSIFSSAGSGDVLKVQEYLNMCGLHPSHLEGADEEATTTEEMSSGNIASSTNHEDHTSSSPETQSERLPKDKKDEKELVDEQTAACLGIAAIAMREDIGTEMAFRLYGHLLQYGDAAVRRIVPLSLGLLSVSYPRLQVMDLLSKLTHDNDREVAYAAIMALGFIGAGTNHARIASLLRQLSAFYVKDSSGLFAVRIAQGILHMGKGLITLSPMDNERFSIYPNAFCGLFTIIYLCCVSQHTLLNKHHYLLYLLLLAARPRMLYTVDEEMKPLLVPVRVGQAVDIVGQAGRPKSITGFQTHTTPVLIAGGERAELATEEYIPVAPSLEGLVVLVKNPHYVKMEDM